MEAQFHSFLITVSGGSELSSSLISVVLPPEEELSDTQIHRGRYGEEKSPLNLPGNVSKVTRHPLIHKRIHFRYPSKHEPVNIERHLCCSPERCAMVGW
jgi:hypothetical protein